MTMIDPERLGPQDFDPCFTGEPGAPDVAADLARGRRRRRRGIGVAVSGGVTALAVAGTLGLTLAPSGRVAVPAAPSPVPSVQVESPFPTWQSSTGPRSPAPSTPAPSAPAADTAPELRRSATGSYLDRDGRSLATMTRTTPFAATRKNTYDLVREHLDPDREHLGSYDRYALTGGGAGSGGVQIGQKLSWKVAGDPGEGLLLVSVTRAAPGERPVSRGEDEYGLCAGTFVESACRTETIDGRRVTIDRQAGGAFVVDLLQADGELASAWVDPVFANNTDVALEEMGVRVAAVVDLLADPDLDVVG